ncbi:MAG: hypothetical protein WA988_20640 [Candidatus Nanopelagicales bacterium]
MIVVVASTALKHGCVHADIEHAFRNPIRVFPQGDGLVMLVGGDASGKLLEVGYMISADGAAVIIHAMPARAKFLKGWE